MTTERVFAVTVQDPETMNLLGLLMKGTLETNLQLPGNATRAAKLKGDVFVRAGGMSVTLRFSKEGISVIKGATEKPRARVGGGMVALLGVVVGSGMVWPVLSGKIRIGGNPFMLLKMLPLIRA